MEESVTPPSCNNGGYVPHKAKKTSEMFKPLAVPVNYTYNINSSKLRKMNSMNAEIDSQDKSQKVNAFSGSEPVLPPNIDNHNNDDDEVIVTKLQSNIKEQKNIDQLIKNQECIIQKTGSYIDGRNIWRNSSSVTKKAGVIKVQDLSHRRLNIGPKESKCINTVATLGRDYMCNRDDETLHRQMRDCINKLPIKHIEMKNMSNTESNIFQGAGSNALEDDDKQKLTRSSRVRKACKSKMSFARPVSSRSSSKSSSASSTFLESTSSNSKQRNKTAELHDAYARNMKKKLKLAKKKDASEITYSDTFRQETNYSNNFLVSGSTVNKETKSKPISNDNTDIYSTEGAIEKINSKLGKKALSLYRDDIRNIASQLENFPEAPADNPESYRGFQELNLDRDRSPWAREELDGIDINAKFGHLTNLVCCDEISCSASIAELIRKKIRLMENRADIERCEDIEITSGDVREEYPLDNDNTRPCHSTQADCRRRDNSICSETRTNPRQKNNNRRKDDTQSESSKPESPTRKYNGRYKHSGQSQLTVGNLRQLTKQHKNERLADVFNRVNEWIKRDLSLLASSPTTDSVRSDIDTMSSTTGSGNKCTYLKKKRKKTIATVKKRSSSHSISNENNKSQRRQSTSKRQKHFMSIGDKADDTLYSVADDTTLSRSNGRKREKGCRAVQKKSEMSSIVERDEMEQSSRYNLSKPEKHNSSVCYKQEHRGNRGTKKVRNSPTLQNKLGFGDKRRDGSKKGKKGASSSTKKGFYCECDKRGDQSPHAVTGKRNVSFHRLNERRSSPNVPKRRSQSLHESKAQNTYISPRRKTTNSRKPLQINIETKPHMPKVTKQDLFEKKVMKERVREASKRRTMEVNRLVKEREDKIERKIKAIEQIKKDGAGPKMNAERYMLKEYPKRERNINSEYFSPPTERRMYGSTYVPIDVDVNDLKQGDYYDCKNVWVDNTEEEDEDEGELHRRKLKNWKIDYYEYLRGREIYNEGGQQDVSIQTKMRTDRRLKNKGNPILSSVSPWKFPEMAIRNVDDIRIPENSHVERTKHSHLSGSESSTSNHSYAGVTKDKQKQQAKKNKKKKTQKIVLVQRVGSKKPRTTSHTDCRSNRERSKPLAKDINTFNTVDDLIDEAREGKVPINLLQASPVKGVQSVKAPPYFPNDDDTHQASVTESESCAKLKPELLPTRSKASDKSCDTSTLVDDKARLGGSRGSNDTEDSYSSLPLQQSHESVPKDKVQAKLCHESKESQRAKVMSLSNDESQEQFKSNKTDQTLSNLPSMIEIKSIQNSQVTNNPPLVLQDLEIDQDVTNIILEELQQNSDKKPKRDQADFDLGEDSVSKCPKVELLSCSDELSRLLADDNESLFMKITNLSQHLKDTRPLNPVEVKCDKSDLKSNVDSFCEAIENAKESLENIHSEPTQSEVRKSEMLIPTTGKHEEDGHKRILNSEACSFRETKPMIRHTGQEELLDTVTRELVSTTPADNMYPTTKTRAIILEAIAAALNKAKKRSMEENERNRMEENYDRKQPVDHGKKQPNTHERNQQGNNQQRDKCAEKPRPNSPNQKQSSNKLRASENKPHSNNRQEENYTNDNQQPREKHIAKNNSPCKTRSSQKENSDGNKPKQNGSFNENNQKHNSRASDDKSRLDSRSNESRNHPNHKNHNQAHCPQVLKPGSNTKQNGRQQLENKRPNDNRSKNKSSTVKSTDSEVQGQQPNETVIVNDSSNKKRIIRKGIQSRPQNTKCGNKSPYERRSPEFNCDFASTMQLVPENIKVSSVLDTTSSSLPLSSPSTSLNSQPSSTLSSHSMSDLQTRISSSTTQCCDERTSFKCKPTQNVERHVRKKTSATCPPSHAPYIQTEENIRREKPSLKKSKRSQATSPSKLCNMMKDEVPLGTHASRDIDLDQASPIDKLSRALAREFLNQTRLNIENERYKRAAARRDSGVSDYVGKRSGRSRSLSVSDTVSHDLGSYSSKRKLKQDKIRRRKCGRLECRHCAKHRQIVAKKDAIVAELARHDGMFEDFSQGISPYESDKGIKSVDIRDNARSLLQIFMQPKQCIDDDDRGIKNDVENETENVANHTTLDNEKTLENAVVKGTKKKKKHSVQPQFLNDEPVADKRETKKGGCINDNSIWVHDVTDIGNDLEDPDDLDEGLLGIGNEDEDNDVANEEPSEEYKNEPVAELSNEKSEGGDKESFVEGQIVKVPKNSIICTWTESPRSHSVKQFEVDRDMTEDTKEQTDNATIEQDQESEIIDDKENEDQQHLVSEKEEKDDGSNEFTLKVELDQFKDNRDGEEIADTNPETEETVLEDKLPVENVEEDDKGLRDEEEAVYSQREKELDVREYREGPGLISEPELKTWEELEHEAFLNQDTSHEKGRLNCLFLSGSLKPGRCYGSKNDSCNDSNVEGGDEDYDEEDVDNNCEEADDGYDEGVIAEVCGGDDKDNFYKNDNRNFEEFEDCDDNDTVEGQVGDDDRDEGMEDDEDDEEDDDDDGEDDEDDEEDKAEDEDENNENEQIPKRCRNVLELNSPLKKTLESNTGTDDDIDALICTEISQCLELVNMSNDKIVKLFSDVEEQLDYSIHDDSFNYDTNNGGDYDENDGSGKGGGDEDDDDEDDEDNDCDHSDDGEDCERWDNGDEDDNDSSYCCNDDADCDEEHEEEEDRVDTLSVLSCLSNDPDSGDYDGREYDDNDEEEDDDDDGDINDNDERTTSHNFKEESMTGFQEVFKADDFKLVNCCNGFNDEVLVNDGVCSGYRLGDDMDFNDIIVEDMNSVDATTVLCSDRLLWNQSYYSDDTVIQQSSDDSDFLNNYNEVQQCIAGINVNENDHDDDTDNDDDDSDEDEKGSSHDSVNACGVDTSDDRCADETAV